jgi:hypothetical protein
MQRLVRLRWLDAAVVDKHVHCAVPRDGHGFQEGS